MRYKNNTRAIAFISDTHVGSKYAIFPEKFETYNGNVIKASKLQLEILKFWNFFISKCKEFNVDSVIHLGDAIEGYNKKEAGFGLSLSNIDDQVDCCVQILEPLVRNRKFYIISGTTYHESFETKIHKNIAHKLNGIYCGYLNNLKIKKPDITINIAHKSSNAMIYLSTMLDREVLFLKMSEAYGKFPKVDLVVRGHLHLYANVNVRDMKILQLPCWKAYQPNALFTGILGKRIPDIGGVIALINPDGRIELREYLMEYSKSFYKFLEKEL